MARMASHHDLIAAEGRERVPEGLIRPEARACLVEIGDLERLREADGPLIRWHLTEDQAQERRLAGAVGPDQAEPVAPHDPEVEIGGDNDVAFGRGEGF